MSRSISIMSYLYLLYHLGYFDQEPQLGHFYKLKSPYPINIFHNIHVLCPIAVLNSY